MRPMLVVIEPPRLQRACRICINALLAAERLALSRASMNAAFARSYSGVDGGSGRL